MVLSVVASGSGIDVNGNGDLNAGHVVTLTVTLSEAVTVAGGTPTLVLNSGGTASYVGGSGTDTLTFSYTVVAGQDTGDLAVSSFNLNGATVQGASGDNADLSGVVTNPPGTLQIDTTAPLAPAIASIVPGGSGGNHWVVTGTAEPNSTVTIFDGATQLDTVTASASGTWTYITVDPVTDSSVHIFTATATDAAGNTGAASAEWIEGSSGNDVFGFGSAAALTAPEAISGNGGADTISMTAAVTLGDGDFAHVSGVQSLQLTGASTITLGADAASAGFVNVTTGSGATSITDSNGITLNVDATALSDNVVLSLSGTAGFTVTGLQGDLAASAVSGALNVTTAAVASGLSIATGSGANTITASALTAGQALDLDGQQRGHRDAERRQPVGRGLYRQSHGHRRGGGQYDHGGRWHQYDHRRRRRRHPHRGQRQRHLQFQLGGQSGRRRNHRRRGGQRHHCDDGGGYADRRQLSACGEH